MKTTDGKNRMFDFVTKIISPNDIVGFVNNGAEHPSSIPPF
jgi:hypothetical protein